MLQERQIVCAQIKIFVVVGNVLVVHVPRPALVAAAFVVAGGFGQRCGGGVLGKLAVGFGRRVRPPWRL